MGMSIGVTYLDLPIPILFGFLSLREYSRGVERKETLQQETPPNPQPVAPDSSATSPNPPPLGMGSQECPKHGAHGNPMM